MLRVERQKKRKRKKGMGRQHKGDAKKFPVACFHRSDGETTFDRDEILDGDSLQCGEHFYGVGFSIPRLDFTIQVGVYFS